jgi:hypothetical protein
MKKAAPTHCCVVRPERGSYCMLSAPCRLPKLYRNGAGAFGSLPFREGIGPWHVGRSRT